MVPRTEQNDADQPTTPTPSPSGFSSVIAAGPPGDSRMTGFATGPDSAGRAIHNDPAAVSQHNAIAEQKNNRLRRCGRRRCFDPPMTTPYRHRPGQLLGTVAAVSEGRSGRPTA
jgi:hypothetical protein